MSEDQSSIDANPLFRYLHMHCFVHMYRVLKGTNPSDYFSKPRFKLFKRIERLYHKKEEHHLFYNLIFTFLREFIVAIIITLISASFNLLVPELIRQFMHFMREKHLKQSQYSDFIQKFILVQFLRIFFSEHSKRLFHQLAIQVQSTLSRKLISKSLRMTKECRDRIPESEIIQLENVDLKLIFNLFKNMNIIFQAPFTIFVAIILLFNESSHYGFIGIYWFLIAFLIQRELDGRMTHCNMTKLKLIEQRSNVNYDLFDKIKAAKLIGWEDVIIQKNNDLFIQENHDHKLFYSYLTLYDITLLMLPIFVVSTITLFDVDQQDPITVEQVYLMLSLLGICYNPMKSVRNISINLHDGLHSLNRLSKYFHFPEHIKSTLIQKNVEQTRKIVISQGTEAMHPHSSSDFVIYIRQQIALQPGQRLCLLGKKFAGCTSFLEMLVGNLKKVKGKILISGKISFFPQKLFFLKDTVKENIRFFNQKITTLEIEEIYNEFGLNSDLRFEGDLNTMIDDTNKFTKTVLKKIAMARCLCSDADIYILDSPFNDMDEQFVQIVEKKLRELQERKKTVVLALKQLLITDDSDKIIILEDGHVIQFDKFHVLISGTCQSKISFFFKSNEDGKEFLEPQTGRVQMRFQQRVKSALNFEIKSAFPIKRLALRNRIQNIQSLANVGLNKGQMYLKQNMPQGQKFESHVMKFLTSVSFKESVFIFIIILAAQVLHIFIHFYIGHLEEQYGSEDYTKYKNLMITEIILTFCLAGLLFLQGEFSTILATVIGNRLYSQSFNELTTKRISWYSNEYSVKLADRYNHDYEEIFIACHSIFGIYKNLVILIATIQFISTNRSKLFALFIVLVSVYYSIFYLFRKIQRRIVKHYFDYKYNFVRILEESIQGAELFNVSELKDEVLKRAEEKYIGLASYKLSASYTNYGLSLICDLLSMSLLAIGLQYGIQMKIHHRQNRISVIATSIFLLMNISQVLKTIIWEMLNFQTFFSVNLIPFMQVKDLIQGQNIEEQLKSQKFDSNIQFEGHQLEFHNVIFQQPGENVKRELINLTIQQGQIVLLYQKDHRCRDLLLYGITKNLPMFAEPAHYKTKNSTIKLGGVSIKSIDRHTWISQFGVIRQQNFYFNGTIKENISWRMQDYDHEQAALYARQLKLYKDFPRTEGDILQVKLTSQHRKSATLIKKIAFMRILLRKPKIVIIQDADQFIESIYMTEILSRQIPGVTIIKISNEIEHSFDVDRIIVMENLKIVEEGSPDILKEDKLSKVGKQIQDINLKSYTFMKKVSKKARQKSSMIGH